jgi:hypothetical protein
MITQTFKMDLKKWDGGMYRIQLLQEGDGWWVVVKVVMNIRVPQNAGNFLIRRGLVSFSRRTLLHGIS